MKNFNLICMALAVVMMAVGSNAASWHTTTRRPWRSSPGSGLSVSKPKSEYLRLDKYLPGSKIPGLLGVAFGEDATKSPEKFTLVGNEGSLTSQPIFFERYTFTPQKQLLNAVRYECHASQKTHKIFRIVVVYPKSEDRMSDSKSGNSEVEFMCKVFAKKFKKNPIVGGAKLYVEDDVVRAKNTDDAWSSWYFVFPDRAGVKVQSGVRIVDRSLDFTGLKGVDRGRNFMYLTINNFEQEIQARKDDIEAKSAVKVKEDAKASARSAIDAL